MCYFNLLIAEMVGKIVSCNTDLLVNPAVFDITIGPNYVIAPYKLKIEHSIFLFVY